jgi:hypothetical protein
MRLQFAVFAQSVSVDRFTNRLSLFNILESVQSPRFPVFLPELVAVFVVRREANDVNGPFDTEIVVTLGGNRIAVSRARVNVDDKPYVRVITNFMGLPIVSAGDLEITLTVPNGDPIRTSIPVIQIMAVQPVPVPGAAVRQ